ncbi:MAG TPA: prolyl oligopeptidase family serine peptidase [Steroidobacteraceae bacterium]
MGKAKLLRRISLALGLAGLLAGCAGVRLGQPTAVPAQGRLDVPQPTATQIGVGQNPSPSAPRMNPLVAQVKPPGGRARANPYGWLENVHSSRTRHWISVENRETAEALARLPQREWIRRRLGQLQGGGLAEAANDVIVERAFYLSPDGTRLPMEIAHRRDLPRDGNRPALLTVYRSTRKPQGRLLTPFALVWLEMGGVYARAEVRNALAPLPAPPGAATPLPDRSIALSDLFAAGQALIDQHYTRRARLGVYGRGFGGLMAGAAVALRPDFFGAALPTGTWPRYRQIASGNCFPPTLVTTAERGGDFAPWQGYELAAVLQAEQICGRPILIRIESQEGPGEPVSSRRQRAADELAFAAKWLGAQPPG